MLRFPAIFVAYRLSNVLQKVSFLVIFCCISLLLLFSLAPAYVYADEAVIFYPKGWRQILFSDSKIITM